ncbi:MAG: F0F1 ATP synthase subunit delta [Candidatus Methylacidiphilales bacterium]|nr:F0F1 ATP synthase subunit delta [Candidatus Methylacidiphilales bacterium]
MKIPRKARASAKRLLQVCRPEGRLDESRVRETVKWLGAEKPRHYLAILQHLARLVAVDEANSTAVIQSPVPLGAAEVGIATALRQRFGERIRIRSEVKPELLGGLRIRVGSDVWDGSLRGRLDTLARTF